MKLHVIVAFLLTIAVLIGLPANGLAQSQLLPEKTTEITTDNTSNNSVIPSNNVATDTANGTTAVAEQNDNSWGYLVIALLLTSLILLFLEIAVIPGFGICGISGIVLLLVALGLAYYKLSSTMAIVATVVAVVGVMILIAFMIWVFPHTSLGRRFVLSETAPVVENEDSNSYSRFLGAEGVATSYLRPSGIARIADERVDVITDGDFVEKGTKIKVIKVSGNCVTVAPVEE